MATYIQMKTGGAAAEPHLDAEIQRLCRDNGANYVCLPVHWNTTDVINSDGGLPGSAVLPTTDKFTENAKAIGEAVSNLLRGKYFVEIGSRGFMDGHEMLGD